MLAKIHLVKKLVDKSYVRVSDRANQRDESGPVTNIRPRSRHDGRYRVYTAVRF